MEKKIVDASACQIFPGTAYASQACYSHAVDDFLGGEHGFWLIVNVPAGNDGDLEPPPHESERNR